MRRTTILKDRSGTNSAAREIPGHTPFSSPRAKLTIGSLDDKELTVVAHYNPAEFAVSKTLPWNPKHEQGNPKTDTRSEQDSHEYKGTPARAVSLELLFDNYETGRSVKPIIDDLEELSTVRDPESSAGDERRPHYCVVAWGNGITLRCIITSFNVRFTMFAHDGTPLRAICNLELQEARLKSQLAGDIDRGKLPRNLLGGYRAVAR